MDFDQARPIQFWIRPRYVAEFKIEFWHRGGQRIQFWICHPDRQESKNGLFPMLAFRPFLRKRRAAGSLSLHAESEKAHLWVSTCRQKQSARFEPVERGHFWPCWTRTFLYTLTGGTLEPIGERVPTAPEDGPLSYRQDIPSTRGAFLPTMTLAY